MANQLSFTDHLSYSLPFFSETRLFWRYGMVPKVPAAVSRAFKLLVVFCVFECVVSPYLSYQALF